jgi:predicted nucleic acid-binding Zn ribbon protein
MVNATGQCAIFGMGLSLPAPAKIGTEKQNVSEKNRNVLAKKQSRQARSALEAALVLRVELKQQVV